MNIVWSDTALETYLHFIDYIFGKWTKKEVGNFQKNVDKLLERLSVNDQLCPASKLLNYKCVVSKQTSLIYSIQNNVIYLVTFIDNRALNNF